MLNQTNKYGHIITKVYFQIHERAASPAGSVRDGNVVYTVRRLLGAPRVHGAAEVLHRALGSHGVPPASSHLLQPPRPAALPHAAAAAREAAPGRGGNQHLRHRMSSFTRTSRAEADPPARGRLQRRQPHVSAPPDRLFYSSILLWL